MMKGTIVRTGPSGLDRGVHTTEEGFAYRTDYRLDIRVETPQNHWEMRLADNKARRRYELEVGAVLAELLKAAALVVDQGLIDALGGLR